MRWNTPLSEAHASDLLDQLDVAGAQTILDLGCGWGELLIRAVAPRSGDPSRRTGVGVDRDEALLERGRRSAARRGLGDAVRFVPGAAERWDQPAQRVLCIGAGHAWGGDAQALAALTAVVEPGGRLLFGDGCWERAPTSAAAELFGTDVLALPELARAAGDAGWRVLHLSTADQREWDEFESTWRAGREQWLAAHGDQPQAPEVRAELDALLAEYLVYRGVLGFAYLVLGR
jgi:cyclopropane fatty-acyl-phospholipid synthase-like methyltransferase